MTIFRKTFRRTCLLVLAVTSFSTVWADDVDKVNPIIGTDNHGHTFVGANVPFGAVQVGPNHVGEGWDWCSGYNYVDPYVKGFAMLHLSGTGCADLGDICVMPVTGQPHMLRASSKEPEAGFASRYSHQEETAEAGYYKVRLQRYGITAEMTATERVGYMRFTFPKATDARIVFDLESAVSDRSISTGVRQMNDRTVTGFRLSRGWASRQYVYFAAQFSKPMKRWQASFNDSVVARNPLVGPNVYGQAFYDTQEGEVIEVKVAISAVSEENALMNLRKELPGWDFAATRIEARSAWNMMLGKIQATFDSKREETAFYTAMFHTMIAPQLFCDVNGDYRGSDGNIYRAPGFTNMTVLSLWDTYRAFHPLATLILPECQRNWAQTFLHIDREQGFLPVWHLMGNETHTMVGLPSVPVLADMILKGFVTDPDEVAEAYAAMKHTMARPMRDLEKFNKFGYIPYNQAGEDVAKALEYGLAYWSLAQISKKLGQEADYQKYMQYSQCYRLLYDAEVGYMRPKDDKGQFLKEENFRPNIQTRHYTEGNPWQYLWLVPHDVKGLVELLGGEAAFTAKLDSLFTAPEDLGDDYTPDIAGMVGQYAHGNEPSHHIIYMYNYVGQPWKAADLARHIMGTLYGDDHNGLPGNEDVGQMSAWYILSAIGLYQVEPCGGRYMLGSPIAKQAKLRVGKDKTFTIVAKNNSDKNRYIQKATLNGKPYTRSWIDYKDIIAGGTLELTMGAKPGKFGTKPADRP